MKLDDLKKILEKVSKLIESPEKGLSTWNDAFYNRIDELRNLLNSNWLKEDSLIFLKGKYRWFLDDEGNLVILKE